MALTSNYRFWFLALLMAALAAMCETPTYTITEEDRQWIRSEFDAATDARGGDAEYRVRPGVVADRKHREIELLAFATGVSRDQPIEFIIVAENGKSYEALAVSTVKPSDIYYAMTFIGMAPGHPVQPESNQFWPRGERVIMSLAPVATGVPPGHAQSVRLEALITDQRRGEPLPSEGFRFVGSTWRTIPPATDPVCMADTYGEIVSIFNSRWTLFDVPYSAEQNQVYGNLVAGSAYTFEAGERLRITIRPEYPDDRKRIVDYTLGVTSTAGAESATLVNLAYTLTDKNQDKVVVDHRDFPQVLAVLQEDILACREPYVRPVFESALPLAAVREFCRLLKPVVDNDIIRLELQESDIHIQAFLPMEQWRDPTQRHRSVHPVEIHFDTVSDHGVLVGRIVHYTRAAPGSHGKVPVLIPFSAAPHLIEQVNGRAPWDTDVLFIMVDGVLSYGWLAELYSRLRNTFPTLYVFLNAPSP